MPTLIRRFTVEEALKIFGWLVLLIALGLILRLAYPDLWWLSSMAHALGDAFMVAGIIGAFVEVVVAKRLIEHVADDLAEKLVGAGLPESLQGHIREVINSGLVRENYVKEYRISHATPGFVHVEMKISYDVRNYGVATEKYLPKFAEEAHYSPELLYVEFGLKGQKPQSFSGAKAQELLKQRPDGRTVAVEGLTPISLNPWRKDPNAIVGVIWRHRVLMPDTYSDVTSFAGATLGATIQLDDAPSDIEFTGAADDAIASTATWTYMKAFLPSQHVRARWTRKP